MKITSIDICKFRNFEDIKLDLTNKNVVFGLNDIGKTNFLCALRFLLDRDFRRNGFVDSDYYNKRTETEISITLEVNIEDETDSDNKKIYSCMKGAISSSAKVVYFQLKSTYNLETLRGEPRMYWGSEINDLEEIPSNQSYFAIDKLFNVVYIDSAIKLDNEFKRYTKEILRADSSFSDKERNQIKKQIIKLNDSIGNLKNIKKFEKELVAEYKKYRNEKNLDISIRSEIELSNLHSKLTPYILSEDAETYPTSGDGRKKILAYTLLTLENRRLEEKKINIFLIEELENHLHRSMQIALSYQLFNDQLFKYLFMTTHSSLIVSQMDDVNLIKLFKDDKVIGKSYTYTVPKEYKMLKHKLNQNLSEAIYADVVLLVEGPSEKILFERILKEKLEKFESYGGYILEVDGINFSEYVKVLSPLGVKLIIKTDNDLKLNKNKKECNLLGLNRCLEVTGGAKKPNIINIDVAEYKSNLSYKKSIQVNIYENVYSSDIDNLRSQNIYLSKIDLENDLFEVIPTPMRNLVKTNNSSLEPIEYLQSAKLINMIDLCTKLSAANCKTIYNSQLFFCLREFVESCSQ
ncbi:AAA family ATPase [Paenibacillus sp. 2TAB23]|uniref:AAA family ATPase n=1 Tax=Paenibacillus sp. 2TAB23 TaxID=3233004 RepID=UPI003F9A0DD6